MSTKIIIAVVVLFAAQLARAQELQIDFDGNSSKSITKLVDFRGPQKPVAKITLKVVSDDGVIELVEPRVDRYEDKHYQFTPGKNHAMIDYVCPGPVGQLDPWYLKLTPPVSYPQEAGHNHALPDILKSKECKQIKNHPCETEPTVKYAYTIDGSPWQGTPDATGMVVSPQLKLNSVFTLSVDIPKYATQLVTHAELVCGNGKSETDYMEIMVPELKELPASSLYVSNGSNAGANPLHQFNHYATTTTVDALISLANQWNSAHSGANKLVFNDMSLKWGGLFDVYGNWRGSHSNHGFGTAIDVSKRCIKKSNRAAFIRLIDSLGFSMLSEGDVATEQNHYHIQHKKEIARLMAIPGFPITENGGMKGVPDYVDESYGSNGGGIDNVPPPPIKTITNCIDLIKSSPTSPYNCDTPRDGLIQPYCKCINRYEVKAGVMAIVDDTQSGEPTGCN